MKRPQSIQISIPKPCHEDWNNMTPQQQGRFCDSCQKCVVDFTGFTDAQVYQFITEHRGQKVCGRFRSTQLNRQIDIPPQPHSQLYKWIIAAGLVLVFVVAPEDRLFAQAPKTVEQLPTSGNIDDAYDNHVSGLITTGDNILSGVKICLWEGGVGKHTIFSDSSGQYSITNVLPGRYNIVADAKGYRKHIVSGALIGSNRHSVVVNFKLTTDDGAESKPIETEYRVPLTDKFMGGSTNIMTGEIETTKQ